MPGELGWVWGWIFFPLRALGAPQGMGTAQRAPGGFGQGSQRCTGWDFGVSEAELDNPLQLRIFHDSTKSQFADERMKTKPVFTINTH